MAVAARVDKVWKDKGLDAYATEAIVGTLAHYGVDASEEAFKTATETCYPLELARRWDDGWKGTGPFAIFPRAAALELWRRWRPQEAAPSDAALAYSKLARFLDERLAGAQDDGTQDTRFKVLEAYLAALPADAARREAYLEEFHELLHSFFDLLQDLVVRLSKAGLVDEAKRLAAIEEMLEPDAAGTRQLLITALTGSRPEALAALEAQANDAAREWPQRFAAVGALLELAEHGRAAPVILAGAQAAIAARDPRMAVWSAGLADALLAEELPDALWEQLHHARLDLEDAFPQHVAAHDHHAHG